MPTAEQALELILRMPAGELGRLLEALQAAGWEGWYGLEEAGYHLVPNALYWHLEQRIHVLYKRLSRRRPRPASAVGERDAEIVRLKDQEGKTFGQIPARLKRLGDRPPWCKTDGSRLAPDTIKKAYYRLKGRQA
jgi:hypothetical protein